MKFVCVYDEFYHTEKKKIKLALQDLSQNSQGELNTTTVKQSFKKRQWHESYLIAIKYYLNCNSPVVIVFKSTAKDDKITFLKVTALLN